MTNIAVKRVLITGVSSGLGEALAALYLQQGWHVYGLSRRKPKLLIDQENFFFEAMDLSEFQSVAIGIRDLIDVKELDLVILNAGIVGTYGDMSETSLEALHEIMDINVWSNKVILDFFTMDEIEVKQVVAISSGASQSGARGWNGYGISKAALNMMVKLYAAERPDCHFSALAPGLVDTPMQDYLCSIEETERYPVLERIKKTRNTPTMPQPSDAAIAIEDAIRKLPTVIKSGEYVDIREMG